MADFFQAVGQSNAFKQIAVLGDFIHRGRELELRERRIASEHDALRQRMGLEQQRIGLLQARERREQAEYKRMGELVPLGSVNSAFTDKHPRAGQYLRQWAMDTGLAQPLAPGSDELGVPRRDVPIMQQMLKLDGIARSSFAKAAVEDIQIQLRPLRDQYTQAERQGNRAKMEKLGNEIKFLERDLAKMSIYATAAEPSVVATRARTVSAEQIAEKGRDVTRRGQDVTARGQDITRQTRLQIAREAEAGKDMRAAATLEAQERIAQTKGKGLGEERKAKDAAIRALNAAVEGGQSVMDAFDAMNPLQKAAITKVFPGFGIDPVWRQATKDTRNNLFAVKYMNILLSEEATAEQKAEAKRKLDEMKAMFYRDYKTGPPGVQLPGTPSPIPAPTEDIDTWLDRQTGRP